MRFAARFVPGRFSCLLAKFSGCKTPWVTYRVARNSLVSRTPGVPIVSLTLPSGLYRRGVNRSFSTKPTTSGNEKQGSSEELAQGRPSTRLTKLAVMATRGNQPNQLPCRSDGRNFFVAHAIAFARAILIVFVIGLVCFLYDSRQVGELGLLAVVGVSLASAVGAMPVSMVLRSHRGTVLSATLLTSVTCTPTIVVQSGQFRR
jgi:hypothetical protein